MSIERVLKHHLREGRVDSICLCAFLDWLRHPHSRAHTSHADKRFDQLVCRLERKGG